MAAPATATQAVWALAQDLNQGVLWPQPCVVGSMGVDIDFKMFSIRLVSLEATESNAEAPAESAPSPREGQGSLGAVSEEFLSPPLGRHLQQRVVLILAQGHLMLLLGIQKVLQQILLRPGSDVLIDEYDESCCCLVSLLQAPGEPAEPGDAPKTRF